MSEQFVVVVKNSPRDRTALEALIRRFAPGQVGEITIAPDRTARIACADEQRARAVEKGLHGKNIAGQRQPLRASVEKVAPPAQPAVAARQQAAPAPVQAVASPIPPSAPLDRPTAAPATGPDQRSKPPFHFVPVLAEQAVTDGPVYHDKLDLATMWTGEVRCTLTTHTPLLAANDQYDIADAEAGVRKAFERVLQGRLKRNHSPVMGTSYAKDKKVLVPLALPGGGEVPGAVLIGGAPLKGMIRQSLAALLAAPMERVQERHFSYRPNIDLTRGEAVRLESRVGIVTEKQRDGSLCVRLLPPNDVTRILRHQFDAIVHQLGGEQAWQARVAELRAATPSQFDQRLNALVASVTTSGRQARTMRRAILPYRYGLDGQGVFNSAFNARHPNEQREAYLHVGINPKADRGTVIVPAEIVTWWRMTVEHLGDDQCGHLLRHPDIGEHEPAARAALACLLEEGWRPGDIVYFEQQGERGPVVTMGHHFRYRWRYQGTVRTSRIRHQRADTLPPSAPEAMRGVMCPRPVELRAVAEGRPEGLSGARLLFGYVGTRNGEYHDREPTTAGIGLRKDDQGRLVQSDFSQLAGRIAFNAAVEENAGDAPEKRFLNTAEGFLVPLRPLGSPKPSAVEHYLDQAAVNARPDDGILCTFGDDGTDATAGDLLGRKFYLHQPMAAVPGERSLFELLADGKRNHHQDQEMLASNQASVGLFVSKPGRTFRFRLRFMNLRDFELGALLFVLSPGVSDLETLARAWGDEGEAVRVWLSARAGNATATRPLLAHKLGHGRPLGLGSVTINPNGLLRVVDGGGPDLQDRSEARQGLIEAFGRWVKDRLGAGFAGWVRGVLMPWLAVHQFAGRELETFEYPRARRDASAADPAAAQLTIYNHHANLRSRHSRGRKQAAQPPRPRHGLQDLT